MQVPIINAQGAQVGAIELPDAIFGIEPNRAVMHQALLRQLANARLGTVKTKTRGEVAGSGIKMWRQKGTGRARQGQKRAPHWRKGGTVFGPRPRSYEQDMPRKMRRLALKSALSAKAQANQIVVLQDFGLSTPKTREMAALVKTIANPRSTLIILPQGDNTVVARSADNLPGVKTLRHDYLNVRDLLGYDTVVLPVAAVAQIEQHYFKEMGLEPPATTSTPATPSVAPAPSAEPSASDSAPATTPPSASSAPASDLGASASSGAAEDVDTDADDAAATAE